MYPIIYVCTDMYCPACAAKFRKVYGGTPGFMSPEVMQSWVALYFRKEPERIDGAKADVYSVGATLYMLLTLDTFLEIPGSDTEGLLYDIEQCTCSEVRSRVLWPRAAAI